MAYSAEIRKQAKEKYLSGWSCREIGREMKISFDTIWRWRKRYKWADALASQLDSREGLVAQIDKLSKGKITESRARKIAMLSKALARLERVEAKRHQELIEKPMAQIEYVGSLKDRILEYPLRLYQRRWFDDVARFRTMLKCRQGGMSWTIAFEMVVAGMAGQRDQLLISTSREQAQNTIRYAREHMKALGIKERGRGSKTEIVLPTGRRIKALPSGWRTTQGYPGDVYFDEFAWYLHQQKVWEAVVPSVTAVAGRVSVVSTPYEAGPHNFFWRLVTNDGGEFPKFSRHTVDINQAVAEGMVIDLEELKALFDRDTWARLYLCKFFSDEDSFFTLAELNECRGVCLAEKRSDWKGSDRRAGWDMAKRRDASELVGVEKLADQVFVRAIETWRRLAYMVQRDRLVSALKKWNVGQLHVDETGVGMAVREIVAPAIPTSVVQHWHTFTQPFKATIAQNLKKLVEEARLVIPHDDRVLISQFLNIKRTATQKGISYDIARNASGHGDRFWALALACQGLEFGSSVINDVELW